MLAPTILQDLLVTMFENGSLVRKYTFDEVRERAELPLVKKRRQEKNSHLTYIQF